MSPPPTSDTPPPSQRSPRMEKYCAQIDRDVARAYKAASEARAKGIDPEDEVSIPLAKDMAERVEGLVSVVEPSIKGSGISRRITELEEIHGKLSWKVALQVALETAQQKFCALSDPLKAMELGIRVGLAYLTLGVVASPLEGFVELKLKKRQDNQKEYFCLMFSGPIRSAGGTAAAVSVVVADYIRSQMGYAEYDATEQERKRAVTELHDYHERITNLQYLPSEEEIEFLVRHLPVQVDGDASERIEVSNYKDLPRIETNRIRNGFCLVIGECLCQKAAKLEKQLSEWGNEFGLSSWKFLKDFVALQKRKKAKTLQKGEGKIQPDFTFIKDLVAGRPILGFPLRQGAFRLRYGRARNSGYSSAAVSPATMFILDKFIAVGTQLKLERPGKAASVSSCDSIEGPLVALEDGSVERVNDAARAKLLAPQVREILYLGDILINYGDFFNRAHPLVPAGYCEEWWILEAEQALAAGKAASLPGGPERLAQLLSERHASSITAAEAQLLSSSLSIPLHPKHTYYWNALSAEQLRAFFSLLAKGEFVEEGGKVLKAVLPFHEEMKRFLELLGIPHTLALREHLILAKEEATLLRTLSTSFSASQAKETEKEKEKGKGEAEENAEDSLSLLNSSCPFLQRDRGGTFIGARMGRPEKAKVRKLDGQPHCLFPVGEQGGRMRSFQAAVESGGVYSDFPVFQCSCGNATVLSVCERCGKRTEKRWHCRQCGTLSQPVCGKHGPAATYARRNIDIPSLFQDVVSGLGLDAVPDLIKGVRGTSNRNHLPEHPAKGVLRAKYNIPVNKDGTTRYDMTQLAITHFTPSEIHTPVKRLKELGYTQDIEGRPLQDEHQVLELFSQDLILPSCSLASEEGADAILLRVMQFVDDLLVRLYHTKPFYKASSSADLPGQLVVALAPHTSAGIVGRIIGFSRTQGFYAHPMFHAATRRDCDGDEACVTMLLDALLNFSRAYLPNTRGATQDAPLVLTSRLVPAEVDDMVFDVDIPSAYPLELYEAALAYRKPWEVRIEKLGDHLNTPRQYEGMRFTHAVSSINAGVLCSSYKTLPSMQDKLQGQMRLAEKIRAVDASEVARIVIEKHFIRDIKGNLRKFSQQEFRCVTCNEKYRRPPLIGKCRSCGGKVIFTISEGSIIKYLEPALSLARHYNVPLFLQQTLEITQKRVESIFGKEKEKQEGLGKWFG